MKEVVVYVVAFFFAPTAGAAIGLLPGLLIVTVGKLFGLRQVSMLAATAAAGFATAWCAFLLASWIGVRPSLLLLAVVATGGLANDIRRLITAGAAFTASEQSPGDSSIYLSYQMELAGRLCGFAAGGWFLL